MSLYNIPPSLDKSFSAPQLQVESQAPINSTSYNEMVSCIYPVSGQYRLLPRLLCYTSLFFAVVARRQLWLVTGALCSAMILGSTAVIHVFVILFASGTDPAVFDSDMVPLSLLLLVGAMFPGPVVDFSKTVRKSGARPIIFMWGLWMMVGTITCMSGLTCISDTRARKLFAWLWMSLIPPRFYNLQYNYTTQVSISIAHTPALARKHPPSEGLVKSKRFLLPRFTVDISQRCGV
ncbi:hypothetical protein HYALB_00011585 [Hymenoscyphus albidus]|uniref:Uncharacterized protein n=1 Tax=Hymenoscyphus albidus TaxID=595503 RepID=A0A9N9LWH0_9HELO|nr:hypothetical protein HYALB_00011585 [Hymenoscyphus albidus]